MASNKEVYNGGASSVVYGMGFIGAAVYFIQNATSFLDGMWGLFEALVWPAILVYQALDRLKF